MYKAKVGCQTGFLLTEVHVRSKDKSRYLYMVHKGRRWT